MRSPRLFFFFCLLPLLVGCDLSQVDWEPHVGPQVFYDAHTQGMARPLFYTWPVIGTTKPESALILPFTVSQDMSDPVRIGTETARTFWRTWVSEGVFPILLFAEEPIWPDKDTALAAARRKGCDVLVMGDITRLYMGGSQGDSSVAIRVDIYSAATGALDWSMEHAGRIEHIFDQDYIVFTKKIRMPESPELVIIRDLALDLSRPVKIWSPKADSVESNTDNATSMDATPDALSSPGPQTGWTKAAMDRSPYVRHHQENH